MAKIRIIKKIEALQPEDLADALVENGFSACRQLIVDKGTTGKQFMGMTEFQLKQWKLFLKPSDLKRLWSFIARIKDHPEEFIFKDASDAEYLNYNAPQIPKKPAVPKRPVDIPVAPRSPGNLPSPAITIVDSLKNQLQEKFKNVIAESSDDLVEDGSSDWSDDEPVQTATNTLQLPIPDPQVEERARKLSAEVFVAKKNKLAQLFSGIRNQEPEIPPTPPIPISPQPIYVNVVELKREQEQKKRALAEKPKMPPKPPILRQQSSKTLLTKRYTPPPPKPELPSRKSDDFENKRNLVKESLGNALASGLPLPPKLPPSFKYEGKLIDLTRTPERPPRISDPINGFDEQVPFDDGPPAPARPSRAAPRHTPTYDPPTNEDDTYEPAPTIGFVSKSLTNFLDNPPPVPKKFPSPIRTSYNDCDDDGYLITVNDVTTSRESLFSKQDTPLPPIPPSTKQYEDALHRSKFFKDVNREGATEILKKKCTGSFLLRPSRKYFCTLVIKSDLHMCNVPIIFSSQSFHLLADENAGGTIIKFKSIDELIIHYTENLFNIKGSVIILKIN